MHEEHARAAISHHRAAASAFAAALLVAGALALEPVRAASDGADASSLASAFETLDTDADGTLSEREWRESSPASSMSDDIAAAHYSMYDVDRNGSVSAEEYERVNDAVLKGREGDAI